MWLEWNRFLSQTEVTRLIFAMYHHKHQSEAAAEQEAPGKPQAGWKQCIICQFLWLPTIPQWCDLSLLCHLLSQKKNSRRIQKPPASECSLFEVKATWSLFGHLFALLILEKNVLQNPVLYGDLSSLSPQKKKKKKISQKEQGFHFCLLCRWTFSIRTDIGLLLFNPPLPQDAINNFWKDSALETSDIISPHRHILGGKWDFVTHLSSRWAFRLECFHVISVL